ncbi:MAG: thioredoxin family protein [Bacteroidales bacterium]|nr:thioredoxin family protein [Bacteroidales bacterium]
MIPVNSHSDFVAKASGNERAFLLLYKSAGDQSQCAYQSLEDATKSKDSMPVYVADVNQVRDIHVKFGIDSVPSLLVFRSGKFENTIKGCHNSDYYKALMEDSVFQAKASNVLKASRQVTVYSTPTCSWCNTLKSWLQKNNIRYTDIDISQNQKAAESLVRRSGQQGVPQTDINGQIVVGFNQPRLKELLEIH